MLLVYIVTDIIDKVSPVFCMSNILGALKFHSSDSDSDSEMFSIDRNVTSATYKLVFSNILRTYKATRLQ